MMTGLASGVASETGGGTNIGGGGRPAGGNRKGGSISGLFFWALGGISGGMCRDCMSEMKGGCPKLESIYVF